MRRQAFTLIELLVVIAIIAILSVVVILTLNPAQLLMQSRDSNRISDMSTVNTALGVYLAEGGNSLGNANTVYVSIPDPSATSTAGDQCQGLGLLSLPAGYTYQCAASSTYRQTNGAGWIPVNFASLQAGSPLGNLPTDPTNTSSSRLYYPYETNGTQYEVTAAMESQKYQLGGSNDVISSDGGILASVYEKGTKLGLEPLDYGDPTLVGWWNFSEGTGTVAYDYSGSNATGSWDGTATGTNGYYSPGKIGPWAGTFDGSSTYINAPVPAMSAITFSAWVQEKATTTYISYPRIDAWTSDAFDIADYNNTGVLGIYTPNLNWQTTGQAFGNTFNFVAVVDNGTTLQVYWNGALIYTHASTISLNAARLYIGANPSSHTENWLGLIDDVRIYNRALTAAQIAAMYAGGK